MDQRDFVRTPAACSLAALGSVDTSDQASAEGESHASAASRELLDKNGPHNARIGVACKLCGFHAGADRPFEQSMDTMRWGGGKAVELTDFVDWCPVEADLSARFCGQKSVLLAQAQDPVTDPACVNALEEGNRLSRAQGIGRVAVQHTFLPTLTYL